MDDENQLLFFFAQSIASGCTARQVETYLDNSPAGMALRRKINDTIPQAHGTLLMVLAGSRDGDDDESIRVAKTLKRYGADVNRADSVIGSTPLNVAADFGRTRLVRWLVNQGAAIDVHPRITPTLAIYLTCQNNHAQCTGILVKAALDQNKVYTLDAKSKKGTTPGNMCMERGRVECMGALTMGGADARQVFAMYWVPPGYSSDPSAPQTDPDPNIQPQASMQQTLLSFTTLQCAQCQTFSPPELQQCSRCRMAHYCSRECQKQDYDLHKKCCKRLRKGQDLVSTTATSLPQPANEPFGFTIPFAGDDFKPCRYHDSDDEEEKEDSNRPVWEYNAGSRGNPDWRRYPIRIEESLESMLSIGGPRYMYRPGNTRAEGMYEPERSAKPPPNIATNYVYWADMLEREFYTGAIRAVRRNGSRASPVQRDDDPF